MSRAGLYRGLRQQLRPRALRRIDRGQPRKMPVAKLERYREIVAAARGQGLTSSTSMIIVSVQSFSRLATGEREPYTLLHCNDLLA